jgi:WD40 repeat protein
MASFKREDGSTIVLGEEIAKGGEGAVYKVPGDPHLAAKIYRAPSPEHTAKLQMMLSKPPIDYIEYRGHTSIAWPEPKGRLFDTQNKCVGFLMPNIHPPTYAVHKLYTPKDRLQKLPGFTWEYLLRTASNLASVVDALHNSGYVIGDMNESNILVTPGAQVTLIDCDSIQIPRGNGLFFRCGVGKGEYTPSELQGVSLAQIDRNKHHDNFSLAVLIFQLLMEGRHPFMGVWKGPNPDKPPTLEDNIKAGNCSYTGSRLLTQPSYALPFEMLPPSVQKLMIRCFGIGHKDPQSRPSAYEWHQVLVEAERYLSSCSVNAQHRYSDHLKGCPWCKRKEMGLPDPFPPRKQLQAGLRQVRPPPASYQAPATTIQLTRPIPTQTTGPITSQPSAQSYRSTPRSSGISRRVFLGGLVGIAAAGGGAIWWARNYTPIETLFTTYRGHIDNVQAAAWSPDGIYIASSSRDKTVHIWEAATGRHIFTYHGHSQSVQAVAWSPDGKRIASASQDKTVRVWDAMTGKHVLTYHDTAAITTLAWSPDGKYIASGSVSALVQVWDAGTGKRVFTYHGHAKNRSASISAVAWSPDGGQIASASKDRTVQVWDATTGKHALIYKGHSLDVLSVAWSPDGKSLASGGADMLVLIWNAATGKTQLTYKEHTGHVTTLAWAPDGQRIASGESQNVPPIKKTATHTHAKTGNGSKTPQANATVTKKSSVTPTPVLDIGSKVRVWEVSSDTSSTFVYQSHTHGVNAVAWSQSKDQIASASGDKTVQVWQVTAQDLPFDLLRGQRRLPV